MGKNILVCDDAVFMRSVIKEIVTNAGFFVVGEAENGKVAVQKYKELKPNLVLMDITMPELTGIEALKEIKKFDSEAKVVMCSAMGQKDMVVDAIKYGARDFIVKPFEREKIIEAVRRNLG